MKLTTNQHYSNIIIGLMLGIIIYYISYTLGTDNKLWVLGISVTLTMLLIIFGGKITKLLYQNNNINKDQINKFKEEEELKGKYEDLKNSLFSRESVFPCFLGISLGLGGYIQWDSLLTVANEKADLVFLILIFALVAEGIRKSGYFKYVAIHVLNKCEGNTARMILSIFIVCGLFSYVFTNDIVILVMVPIILAICHEAKLNSSKLLLVTVFFAANAMAMGLLIGPPKNIIVARGFDLNFLEYATLLLLPSIFTFAAGLFATCLLIKLKIKDNLCSYSYKLSENDTNFKFTTNMSRWIWLYLATIIYVILNTTIWGASFFTAFLLIIPIAVYFVWKYGQKTESLMNQVYNELLARLPLQIFIFAFVFFIISEEFSHELTDVHKAEFIKFLTQSKLAEYGISFWNIIFPGILSNFLNDLPISSLMSDLISNAEINNNISGNEYKKSLIIQSLSVGLEIGAYLTPIGTLAALIWFHLMRTQGEGIETPGWTMMLGYGLIHFIISIILLTILLPSTLPITLEIMSLFSDNLPKTQWNLGGWEVMILILFFILVFIPIYKYKIPIMDLFAILIGKADKKKN